MLGVDVSERQIELARENVPNASFQQSDIMDLRFPDESFDAVVAFYVLDHVPRDRHAELFDRIAVWLKPGGLLLFTAETEDEPGTTHEWLGVEMYFSSFDREETLRRVASLGFDIQEHAVEVQREGERDVPFLWVLARKPGGLPADDVD